MSGSGPVLVTGATGLVGRALVERMTATGIPLLGISRFGNRPHGQVLAIDLTKSRLDLTDLVDPPLAVVHLAAALPHAQSDTDDTANLTRRMDRTVVDAVRRWKCAAIYISTCGLYDPLCPEPKREDASPVSARTPYFAAKLEGERLFSELDAVILRLSAPVGPALPRRLVLARFIEAAISGAPLPIWGSGRREQSFVDARDVATAIMDVLASPVPGIFNLAAAPVAMLHLAQTVACVIGSGEPVLTGDPDPAEGHTARYDTARIARAIGWTSSIPLHRSVAWVAESIRLQQMGNAC